MIVVEVVVGLLGLDFPIDNHSVKAADVVVVTTNNINHKSAR